MEPLEQKLTELAGDIKTFTGKAQDELKSLGVIATETKASLDTMKTKMHEMQNQLDAVDTRTQHRIAPATQEKSLGELFTTSEPFLKAKEQGFGGGTGRIANATFKASPFQVKTNITETNLGNATTGVIVQQRLPGIVGMAQQALRIRDVMNVITQDTGNSFDFAYQATRTNAVSPQVEAGAKVQSYYNWAATSGAIRTLAHYVKVSRQALDDVPWLRGLIDTELIYGLKVKEEAEILSGDGTGVHLNGIITQATAFSTGLLHATAGWTRLDVLRYAKLQARLAGLATYPPNAFVLHPTDMAEIEVTKDSYGRYIVGDPQGGAAPNTIWGLPVVESDSITAGTFLTGAFNTAAQLIDRQQATVEIAYQNDTDFIYNLATVLCEERLGLAVTKATAFITGSFSTSPA